MALVANALGLNRFGRAVPGRRRCKTYSSCLTFKHCGRTASPVSTTSSAPNRAAGVCDQLPRPSAQRTCSRTTRWDAAHSISLPSVAPVPCRGVGKRRRRGAGQAFLLGLAGSDQRFRYAGGLRAGDTLDGIGSYTCCRMIDNCRGSHPRLPICLASVTLARHPAGLARPAGGLDAPAGRTSSNFTAARRRMRFVCHETGHRSCLPGRGQR
jgi:hypothetical protein